MNSTEIEMVKELVMEMKRIRIILENVMQEGIIVKK